VADIVHAVFCIDRARCPSRTFSCRRNKYYFTVERAFGLGRFCNWALSWWWGNYHRHPNVIDVGSYVSVNSVSSVLYG